MATGSIPSTPPSEPTGAAEPTPAAGRNYPAGDYAAVRDQAAGQNHAAGQDHGPTRGGPAGRRVISRSATGRADGDRRGSAPATGRYCSGRSATGDVAVRSTLAAPFPAGLHGHGRATAPASCATGPRIRPDGPRVPNGGRVAAPDGATHSYHVFNALGEVLGSFGDWDTAHAWAHDQADQVGARVPLEVEDRPNRITRRVWRARCEFVAWETVAHIPFACERMNR